MSTKYQFALILLGHSNNFSCVINCLNHEKIGFNTLANDSFTEDFFYLSNWQIMIKNRNELNISLRIINKKLNQLKFYEFINNHKIFN